MEKDNDSGFRVFTTIEPTTPSFTVKKMSQSQGRAQEFAVSIIHPSLFQSQSTDVKFVQWYQLHLVIKRAVIVEVMDMGGRMSIYLLLLDDRNQINPVWITNRRLIDAEERIDRISLRVYLPPAIKEGKEEGDGRCGFNILTYSFNGTEPKKNSLLPVRWSGGLTNVILTILDPLLPSDSLKELSETLGG
jgi:hypothetical protein